EMRIDLSMDNAIKEAAPEVIKAYEARIKEAVLGVNNAQKTSDHKKSTEAMSSLKKLEVEMYNKVLEELAKSGKTEVLGISAEDVKKAVLLKINEAGSLIKLFEAIKGFKGPETEGEPSVPLAPGVMAGKGPAGPPPQDGSFADIVMAKAAQYVKSRLSMGIGLAANVALFLGMAAVGAPGKEVNKPAGSQAPVVTNAQPVAVSERYIYHESVKLWSVEQRDGRIKQIRSGMAVSPEGKVEKAGGGVAIDLYGDEVKRIWGETARVRMFTRNEAIPDGSRGLVFITRSDAPNTPVAYIDPRRVVIGTDHTISGPGLNKVISIEEARRIAATGFILSEKLSTYAKNGKPEMIKRLLFEGGYKVAYEDVETGEMTVIPHLYADISGFEHYNGVFPGLVTSPKAEPRYEYKYNETTRTWKVLIDGVRVEDRVGMVIGPDGKVQDQGRVHESYLRSADIRAKYGEDAYIRVFGRDESVPEQWRGIMIVVGEKNTQKALAFIDPRYVAAKTDGTFVGRLDELSYAEAAQIAKDGFIRSEIMFSYEREGRVERYWKHYYDGKFEVFHELYSIGGELTKTLNWTFSRDNAGRSPFTVDARNLIPYAKNTVDPQIVGKHIDRFLNVLKKHYPEEMDEILSVIPRQKWCELWASFYETQRRTPESVDAHMRGMITYLDKIIPVFKTGKITLPGARVIELTKDGAELKLPANFFMLPYQTWKYADSWDMKKSIGSIMEILAMADYAQSKEETMRGYNDGGVWNIPVYTGEKAEIEKWYISLSPEEQAKAPLDLAYRLIDRFKPQYRDEVLTKGVVETIANGGWAYRHTKEYQKLSETEKAKLNREFVMKLIPGSRIMVNRKAYNREWYFLDIPGVELTRRNDPTLVKVPRIGEVDEELVTRIVEGDWSLFGQINIPKGVHLNTVDRRSVFMDDRGGVLYPEFYSKISTSEANLIDYLHSRERTVRLNDTVWEHHVYSLINAIMNDSVRERDYREGNVAERDLMQYNFMILTENLNGIRDSGWMDTYAWAQTLKIAPEWLELENRGEPKTVIAVGRTLYMFLMGQKIDPEAYDRLLPVILKLRPILNDSFGSYEKYSEEDLLGTPQGLEFRAHLRSAFWVSFDEYREVAIKHGANIPDQTGLVRKVYEVRPDGPTDGPDVAGYMAKLKEAAAGDQIFMGLLDKLDISGVKTTGDLRQALESAVLEYRHLVNKIMMNNAGVIIEHYTDKEGKYALKNHWARVAMIKSLELDRLTKAIRALFEGLYPDKTLEQILAKGLDEKEVFSRVDILPNLILKMKDMKGGFSGYGNVDEVFWTAMYFWGQGGKSLPGRDPETGELIRTDIINGKAYRFYGDDKTPRVVLPLDPKTGAIIERPIERTDSKAVPVEGPLKMFGPAAPAGSGPGPQNRDVPGTRPAEEKGAPAPGKGAVLAPAGVSVGVKAPTVETILETLKNAAYSQVMTRAYNGVGVVAGAALLAAAEESKPPKRQESYNATSQQQLLYSWMERGKALGCWKIGDQIVTQRISPRGEITTLRAWEYRGMGTIGGYDPFTVDLRNVVPNAKSTIDPEVLRSGVAKFIDVLKRHYPEETEELLSLIPAERWCQLWADYYGIQRRTPGSAVAHMNGMVAYLDKVIPVLKQREKELPKNFFMLPYQVWSYADTWNMKKTIGGILEMITVAEYAQSKSESMSAPGGPWGRYPMGEEKAFRDTMWREHVEKLIIAILNDTYREQDRVKANEGEHDLSQYNFMLLTEEINHEIGDSAIIDHYAWVQANKIVPEWKLDYTGDTSNNGNIAVLRTLYVFLATQRISPEAYNKLVPVLMVLRPMLNNAFGKYENIPDEELLKTPQGLEYRAWLRWEFWRKFDVYSQFAKERGIGLPGDKGKAVDAMVDKAGLFIQHYTERGEYTLRDHPFRIAMIRSLELDRLFKATRVMFEGLYPGRNMEDVLGMDLEKDKLEGRLGYFPEVIGKMKDAQGGFSGWGDRDDTFWKAMYYWGQGGKSVPGRDADGNIVRVDIQDGKAYVYLNNQDSPSVVYEVDKDGKITGKVLEKGDELVPVEKPL
ncbi:MAG: hypothetical protein HQL30_09470, partial [Candidatus Omnitrophica bacterium]|nr:hypothetical protein [Candidatus Omnitrophota bacterium]